MTERKTTKLKCIITGRELLATNDYFNKKVEKAGSAEKVHETYVCKEAKNLLIKGYSVDKIREILEINETLQDVDEGVINEIIITSRGKARRLSKAGPTNLPTIMLTTETDPRVTEFLKNI